MEKAISGWKRIWRKKWLWISIIIVVLIAGGVWAKSRKPVIPEYSSAVVERQKLVQSVGETGSLVSSLEVSYSFETGGKIVDIRKKVGDSVKKGDVIAEVDSKAQKARLGEAYAALSSVQARLNLEIAGPNEEDRKKSEASVSQAKKALEQAEASLQKAKSAAQSQINTAEKALATAENSLKFIEGQGQSQLIADAYEDLVNAISSAAVTLSSALVDSDEILGIDNLFANDDFEDVLGVLDSSKLNQAKNSYYGAKQSANNIQKILASITNTENHSEIESAASQAQSALSVMQLHLLDVEGVLSATMPIGELSQTELSTLKTNINTARSSVSTASSNISNAKQAITSAANSLTSYKIAYDKAVLDLANTKIQTNADVKIAEAQVASQQAALVQAEASHQSFIAPPRTVDLGSLRADVQRQAANISAVLAELNKTKVIASAPGIIAKMDLKVGENASIGQLAAVVVSPEFNVEVDISESDIAKIAIDDTAHITFDALSQDEVYGGEVVTIESAKTEISGVIYFKTKILLSGKIDSEKNASSTKKLANPELKSGMTADVEIFTDERENILVIPQRAMLEKNGKKVVRVLIDKELVKYEEQTVETGLRGNDGLIEIVSGLNEGDEVITFIDN